MRSNHESRLVSLDARQPFAKSDSQKLLEKCTDGELRRLLDITEKGGNHLDKLPPEDIAFLEGLNAKYRCIRNLLNDFDKKLKVIKWADQDLEIGIDLTAKL